jgi:hypothetical protein
MTDYMETAVRVWPEILPPLPTKRWRRPKHVLVFDCETTTDASQHLSFGSYRYYRAAWRADGPNLTCVEEGIFLGDRLQDEDPAGLVCLRSYTQTRSAEVAPGFPTALKGLSRREFADLLLQEAYRKRTLIVGFNLPFDLSRLAVGWGEARKVFRGGHSLVLWEYEDDKGVVRENRYAPRVAIKSIDSKQALKGFASPAEVDPLDAVVDEETNERIFRGNLLDLRTLVFSLTDKSHSLASACEAFDVEHGKEHAEQHGVIDEAYIDYNRADVRATAELYVALMGEYVRHPITLQPTKAYSPASIGKAYLRAMGIRPVLERQPDFPREVLGWTMSAYFGGRAECRIRKVPVSVVYLDFLSMYPTVNALMGLWAFQIARRIDVREDTEAARRLVEDVTRDDCFDPSLWSRLRGFALVKPEGDILPVRARYDDARDGYQIGVNPLTSEPRWYALADVVASKLLTGRCPQIVRAVLLLAEGTSPGLRPVKLRGEVEVEPLRDDLFRAVIERRQRIRADRRIPDEERDRMERFLKVFANATSYGIFAEMNRHEGQEADVVVYGPGQAFTTRIRGVEVPGEFCFPPIPAWIAAGARLMLAMLETEVTARGGAFAVCDTDSMAVVAIEDGGSIPELPKDRVALSWADVEAIRGRFEAVNPYDRSAVPGSVLKLEGENLDPTTGERRQLWCYAISAKRYQLFER